MTAFANSHLTVLKQSTAAIISTVRIYGNLLSQIIRMLFLFLYIENFNFRYHSAFLWINYFSYSQILIELFFLSFSVSSLWCHHTPAEVHGLRPLPREAFPVVEKRNWWGNPRRGNESESNTSQRTDKANLLSRKNIRSVCRTQQGFRKFRTC